MASEADTSSQLQPKPTEEDQEMMEVTPVGDVGSAREACERQKRTAFIRLDAFHKQLLGLYEELGVPSTDWTGMLSNTWSQVTAAMQEDVEEERRRVRSLTNKINETGHKLLELARQLGREVAEPDENLSLLQLDQHLRSKLSKLEEEKGKIMQKMQLLRDEEASLCKILDMPPLQLSAPIPQDADFHEVRVHIQMLVAEREKRTLMFATLKQRLVTILESLERPAGSQLELDVVWSPEVRLGEKHLADLESHVLQLEAEDGRNRTEAARLRSKLGELWARLEVEQQHRDEFLTGNGDHRPSTLERLRAEVALQEELKRQNVETFVRKLRLEIDDLWERCYFSLQQRQEFTPFFSEIFTEETLEAHERELEKLKAYFQRNNVLLKDVDEHQRLWRKMLELEERATDHNRYNNRGGRLLLEEKERKKIARRLPKLEQDLQQLIENWQQEHGTTFLVHGHDFAAFIERQKAEHEERLEREKEERATKKASRIQHETMFGARPRTPATQRRAAASPSKRRPLESTRLGAASPGPLGRSARTPLALFNPTVVVTRNTSLLRTAPGKLGGARELSSGSDMTYAEFARNLQRLQVDGGGGGGATVGQSPALRAASRSRRRRSQRLAGLPPRAGAEAAAATGGAAGGATPGRSRLAAPSPGRVTTPRSGRRPLRNRALLGLPAVF